MATEETATMESEQEQLEEMEGSAEFANEEGAGDEEVEEEDLKPITPKKRGRGRPPGSGKSKWKSEYNLSRKYNPSWEVQFPWLMKAPDSEKGYCRVCKNTLLPKIFSIQKHEESGKHQRRAEESGMDWSKPSVLPHDAGDSTPVLNGSSKSGRRKKKRLRNEEFLYSSEEEYAPSPKKRGRPPLSSKPGFKYGQKKPSPITSSFKSSNDELWANWIKQDLLLKKKQKELIDAQTEVYLAKIEKVKLEIKELKD